MGDDEEELRRVPRNYGGFLKDKLGMINNAIWERYIERLGSELNNPDEMNGSYLRIMVMMHLRGNERKFTIEEYNGKIDILAVECFMLKCQLLSIGVEMRYKLRLKTYDGRKKVQLKVKILKKEVEAKGFCNELFDNNIRF